MPDATTPTAADLKRQDLLANLGDELRALGLLIATSGPDAMLLNGGLGGLLIRLADACEAALPDTDTRPETQGPEGEQ